MPSPSTLSLLPQSQQAVLNNQEMKIRLLRLVEFFTAEIVETLKDFYQQKKLLVFDSHVGDTLCQIRAYQILLGTARSKSTLELKNVEENLCRFEKIYQAAKKSLYDLELLKSCKGARYNKALDSQEQISDFLSERGLLFHIPQDLLFLVQGRFLATFSNKDEYGISISINYQKIIDDINVANTTARKIPRLFQKEIAEISGYFIMGLLKELSHLKNLQLILPLLQRIDNHRRKVLPCYEATRVIMDHLLHKKQCILIIVHRLCNHEIDQVNLLFIPKEDGSGFHLCQKVNENYLMKPCLIIRGTTHYQDVNLIETKNDFIRRFTNLGVVNVILSNMANHQQYSAKEFELISDNPYKNFLQDKKLELAELQQLSNAHIKTKILQLEKIIAAATELESELLKMKQLGKEMGCCIENPSLFFIKHIFCDLVENQLKTSNLKSINSSKYVSQPEVLEYV